MVVDINQADTNTWKLLPGIGSVLARRIVGFRESLGGFNTPEQLIEVYGLRDSTLKAISPNLIASPVFRKIKINEDLPLIRPHPYLSIKDSRVIANYINQNGAIKSPEQLTLILAFEEKFWEKILPYLSFDMADSR